MIAQDIEDIAEAATDPKTKEVLQTVSGALHALAAIDVPENSADPLKAAQVALFLAQEALRENPDPDLQVAVLALKILLRRVDGMYVAAPGG
jgi:hypothetical protein